MIRRKLSFVVLILIAAPSFADDAVRARGIVQQLSELAASGGSSLISSNLSSANVSDEVHDIEFMNRWLTRNSESIIGVGQTPFKSRQPFGTATQKGNKLYLHVRKLSEDNTLQIPRLHNSVLRVSTLGEPIGEKPFNIKPGVDEWTIAWSNDFSAENLPVIVLELDSPPRVASGEVPLVKQRNGEIVLHSRDGVPHGKMLRFEPQPHKNTIGYWIHESDWVEWKFQPSATQEFDVVLRYGCGVGQGGSQVSLSFEEHGSNEGTEIPFTVEATGGFQNWRDQNVGAVQLMKDRKYELTVKPIRKANAAIMDIQQITLVPK